ncbi:MAG: hypothetical protein AB1896_00360 [Thermodesulfobacteriota bacterium]
MPVKLLQYWNVRSESRAGFDSFFSGEFVPEVTGSGLMKITGSWHVASGEGPYFIAEGVSRSLVEVQDLVMGPVFQTLRRRLLLLASDYATKLLLPADPAGVKEVEVERGFKFTQHFNVNPADHFEYLDFTGREYLPALARFGLETVGGWTVAVGATPYVINESRAADLGLIGHMLESREYQDLTLRLLGLVTGYGCKILVPSGHVNRIEGS